MKANILYINAIIPYCLKYFFSKMEARGWSCYGTFDFSVERLVSFLVDLLRFAVQIRWNRHLAALFQDL